jgi:dienelactone hydrolase
MNYGRVIEPVSMRRESIAFGTVALLLFAVSAAQAQEFDALPVQGASPAHAGPYEVLREAAFGLSGHIVFRPANLDKFPREDTLPVMVWANGGCASDSSPYVAFLTTIASHGFLVLATTPVNGARDPFPTGDSAPAGYDRYTSPFRAALEWAESEAARDSSPLKAMVATDRMAAMGHSCGGGLAVMVGADPRINTVGDISSAAWGSVHLDGDPRNVHINRLHGPVLLINGGESDIAMVGSAESFEAIHHVQVFYGARRDGGHMSTFGHAGGGEFANVASNWLKWTLKGDPEAGAMFVGPECELCANANWETRSKVLESVQAQ